LKRSTKTKFLGGLGLIIGAVLLSSCTANFCSNEDKANIAYPWEQGVTVYCDKADIPSDYVDVAKQVYAENDNLYYYVPVDTSGSFASANSTFLNTIIKSAKSSYYKIPSQGYFQAIDQKVLDLCLAEAIDNKDYQYDFDNNKTDVLITKANLRAIDINPFTTPNVAEAGTTSTGTVIKEHSGILRTYGYLKFLGYKDNNGKNELTLWANWDKWTDECRVSTDAGLGEGNCPGSDFTTLYKNQVNSKLSNSRSCIATVEGNYGHYGNSSDWAVAIESKDWNYAWSKGFLEGLIVYPVALMVDNFANGIGGTEFGFGQIWAIILVTLIVRSILMLLTFKSTMDQQKMQMIQPQLAKLQAKYPNSNSNRSEQARLSQEQMALYKRNKINPSSSIITLIIQFPVFIAVWSALEGSSVLSTGAFLNLRLSDNIQTALFNTTGLWYQNVNGWWTALVLFIIMAVSQFLSMMLPQWITKARNKNMPKLTKNPAQDKASSQMKWVSYGMLIFTIIMGFFLPAAMGVYWSIGAIISMIQTLITQAIMIHSQKKKERGI